MGITLKRIRRLSTKNFPESLVGFSIGILFLILPHIDFQGYVHNTVTSKTIFLLFSCIIILLFFNTYLLNLKSIRIKISKLDIVLILLLFYIFINRFLIQDDFYFSIRFIELLGLGFLYIVIKSLKSFALHNILISIMVSGSIQAIYGNLQLLGILSSNHSGFNITGSFFNPGPYAGFLALVWCISFTIYLYYKEITSYLQAIISDKNDSIRSIYILLYRYIPIISLITITLVIPATKSRASWVAIIIGGLFVLFKRHSKAMKESFANIKFPYKIALFICFSTISIFSIYKVYEIKKDSANGRLLIWKISKNIWDDHKAFGVGFDQFKAHYLNYQADYFISKNNEQEIMVSGEPQYAFNEYLQFLVENGIIGLVLLVIAGIIIIRSQTKSDYYHLLLLSKVGLIGIGLFSFFSYPMQILPIKLILVLLIATISNLIISKNEIEFLLAKNNSKKVWFKTLLVLITIPIILYGINFTTSFSKNLQIRNEAYFLFKNELFEESIDKYTQILPFFRKDGRFLNEYGRALMLNDQCKEALLILERGTVISNSYFAKISIGECYKKLRNYKKAESAYIAASNMKPYTFYPQYLLAVLYDDTNQSEKAIRTAKKLLNKKIKIYSPAISEMIKEMNRILDQ